jgi:hypothetical protein
MLPERTVPYKSWVKSSLVEAFRPVFANHPDEKLRRTKVSIDYPTSELQYPSVVIRFYEREIKNAGVGHVEFILMEEEDPFFVKFRHYLYDGDIELAIFALSSFDRDLISDTIVQTFAMHDMASYTESFWNRIYHGTDPKAAWNYVNLNTDRILGFGESQTPQPWLSEDQLVYQSSYRIAIYGEFYNLPPDNLPPAGLISKVNVYPYLQGEPVPNGTDDPAPWDMPTDSFQTFI